MLVATLRPATWQTGNGLFVYAYCYLLAKALGYAADIQPVQGFPNTFKPVEGLRTEADPVTISDAGNVVFDEPFEQTVERCRGKKVIVYGHMERSVYYLPHRDTLRHLFEPAFKVAPSTEVALHIRGNDVRERADIKLGISYYEQALKLTGREGAVVYTDDPNWEEYQALGLPIKHRTALEDFSSILAARRIIVPKSSFAWWAAFLSDAEMVVQPEPLHSWRSRETVNAYLHVPHWKQIEVP